LLPQVIPLFMQQDTSDPSAPSETPPVPVEAKKQPSDLSLTMIPPQELIAFPPLAYLLNTILIGLNHLKDCPLLSLQAPLAIQLRDLFSDLCGFLCDHSLDIKEKGKKYFINRSDDLTPTQRKHEEQEEQGEGEALDEIYSTQMVQNVIQYSLLCFQLIYTGPLPLSLSLSPRLSHSLDLSAY
jgi:hypothetical protein